ncbi:MAG: hypothetical protein QMD05_07085 [Candidatus Brocadiaceae bacterium]|nr:hypothetical protein [Candidatus Brocadiaceae bacterium]
MKYMTEFSSRRSCHAVGGSAFGMTRGRFAEANFSLRKTTQPKGYGDLRKHPDTQGSDHEIHDGV